MGYNSGDLKAGKKTPIYWDTAKLINGHVLIMGRSGTGKTYTIRKFLDQILEEANQNKKRVRVHIMDIHGDIEIDGASTVKFSESTPYGFNPLMINADPDFGGVRKRIQSFIATINRSGRKLGSKQEAVLRNVLLDLYAANGFYENDSNSWKINDGIQRAYPKKHPTMEDAVRFANSKLKGMFLGTSSQTVLKLEELYKKQNAFYRKMKKGATQVDPLEKAQIEEELKKSGEETIELFKGHLETMQTGHEFADLMKYDSKDVMKSVVDRLENINSSGIFRAKRPPFDNNAALWRYDIRALLDEEKKLFVYFLLEALFQNASQRGIQDDVMEIIIVDEAHKFLDDDSDNPLNIIAKEARKFGLGLLAASQSPSHFSEDFLSNVSTKIILGIDEMFWDKSIQRLKITKEALQWIVPHHKMVMQMNIKGQTKNPFLWVALKE